MRDADRIERIVTNREARMQLPVCTSRVQRIVRKDLNIVSASLYFIRGEAAKAISEAMIRAEKAVAAAEEKAAAVPAVTGIAMDCQTYSVRVVSPFGARLVRVLMQIDRINATAIAAEIKGRVSRKERMHLVVPTFKELDAIKALALGLPARKKT